MPGVVIKQAGQLRTIASGLLQKAGASEDIAGQVADSLVLSNLKGVDSHGVIKVPGYLQKIRHGELNPKARPRLRSNRGATASVDGCWGFGQIAGRHATAVVVRLAREYGVATVAVTNCNHVGRTGEYVERIASEGLVALAMCSGANPGGNAAPYGGTRRLLGTNPIAWGIPRTDGKPPIVTDFATSAIAAGKLDVLMNEGKQVPDGALLDRTGRPTTDPAAFGNGGALLPFGQQKGYGLMLVIEILVNTWAGFAPASSKEFTLGNPMVLVAWDPDVFTDRMTFDRLVDELAVNLKGVPPSDGFEAVLLPGELEEATQAHRSARGIPLPVATWSAILREARELNLTLPEGA